MPPNPDVSRPSVSDVRRRLLERAGGSSDTAGVARRLQVPEEEVQGRARRGELLSYRDAGGRRRFPNAQFSGGDVLPGLEEVLDAMHIQDPWMRIQLFLDDDVRGALMDGRVRDAVRAVDSYLAPEGGRE